MFLNCISGYNIEIQIFFAHLHIFTVYINQDPANDNTYGQYKNNHINKKIAATCGPNSHIFK